MATSDGLSFSCAACIVDADSLCILFMFLSAFFLPYVGQFLNTVLCVLLAYLAVSKTIRPALWPRLWQGCIALFWGNILLLMQAYLFDQFHFLMVVQNSHTGLPWFYKICALWGNHAGSFFFFTTLLATILWGVTRLELTLIPKAAFMLLGMLLYTVLAADPFAICATPDMHGGLDLNPALQDPSLILHPPILYLGQCFFAVLTLLLFLPYERALPYVRMLLGVSWTFLTLGIGLGAFWAYYELGWGGFWFWDPVENLALVPWFMVTLLLHAVIEGQHAWVLRWGRLSFLCVILCTVLVRSGLLTSVHGFALDPTQSLFLMLLACLSALPLFFYEPQNFAPTLIPFWKQQGFLMLALLFLVLGTCLPAFWTSIQLDQTFFNTTLGLCMAAHFIHMGRACGMHFFGYFLGAAVFGLTWNVGFCVVAALMLGSIAFAASALIFHKSLLRHGAHVGLMVVLLGAVLTTTWEREDYFTLSPGMHTEVLGKTLYLERMENISRSNHQATRFYMKCDHSILIPEQRFYTNNNEHLQTVFTSGWLHHTHLSARMDGGRAIFNITHKPYINLVWLGLMIMILSNMKRLYSRLRSVKVKH